MRYTQEQIAKLTKSHPYNFEQFKDGKWAIDSTGIACRYIASTKLRKGNGDFESTVAESSKGILFLCNTLGKRSSDDTIFVAMVPEKTRYYYAIYLDASGCPATTLPHKSEADVMNRLTLDGMKNNGKILLIEIRSFEIEEQ